MISLDLGLILGLGLTLDPGLIMMVGRMVGLSLLTTPVVKLKTNVILDPGA